MLFSSKPSGTLSDNMPDWRGFDEQVIPDGVWHYQNNAYAQSWKAFQCSRSMTGLVNTWIWRLFNFKRSAWITVSLCLHALNTILLLGLLMNLGMRFSTAGVAAIVFLVHPIQLSAILQTAARSGIQCATFAYSALLCLATGFWPVAILAQFLAQKSKEDAWLYLVFWPMVWFL